MQGHQAWVSSLSDARLGARKALLQASVKVADPEQVLWPHVGIDGMTPQHKAVVSAHAAVLDYADHVSPFHNRCSNYWTKQLDSHELPEGETLDVALSELHNEWVDRLYEQTVTVEQPRRMAEEKTHIKRVHLPLSSSRTVYRALNKCLESIGLAAQVEPARGGDIATSDGAGAIDIADSQ